jgi:hypothetical protein
MAICTDDPKEEVYLLDLLAATLYQENPDKNHKLWYLRWSFIILKNN